MREDVGKIIPVHSTELRQKEFMGKTDNVKPGCLWSGINHTMEYLTTKRNEVLTHAVT